MFIMPCRVSYHAVHDDYWTNHFLITRQQCDRAMDRCTLNWSAGWRNCNCFQLSWKYKILDYWTSQMILLSCLNYWSTGIIIIFDWIFERIWAKNQQTNTQKEMKTKEEEEETRGKLSNASKCGKMTFHHPQDIAFRPKNVILKWVYVFWVYGATSRFLSISSLGSSHISYLLKMLSLLQFIYLFTLVQLLLLFYFGTKFHFDSLHLLAFLILWKRLKVQFSKFGSLIFAIHCWFFMYSQVVWGCTR